MKKHTANGETNKLKATGKRLLKGKENRGVEGQSEQRSLWFPAMDVAKKRLTDLWHNYVRVFCTQIKAVTNDDLEEAFFLIFENNPIISFRLPIPKALNREGEELLTHSKLWILWGYVLLTHRQATPEEVLTVLQAGKPVARPSFLLSNAMRRIQSLGETAHPDILELSANWSALTLTSPDESWSGDCSPLRVSAVFQRLSRSGRPIF